MIKSVVLGYLSITLCCVLDYQVGYLNLPSSTDNCFSNGCVLRIKREIGIFK
ncbi:hypothetical protein GcM3_c19592o11 [Golovinomyces cichoracearum]|uniref:Effector protein n=1 Tax=Golovinomyces cichoracearum TaxID=62708 RepID=A0A420IRU4_9PEZI|nr:hypothetical protein GcM3_c19592o11 [Golovinomyces cichoracearum]